MRITRPPNKPIEKYEQYRIAANIGCDKCPYCGAPITGNKCEYCQTEF